VTFTPGRVNVATSQDEPLWPGAHYLVVFEACSTNHWHVQTGVPVYVLFFFSLTSIASTTSARQLRTNPIPPWLHCLSSPFFPFIFLATTVSLAATRGTSTHLNIRLLHFANQFFQIIVLYAWCSDRARISTTASTVSVVVITAFLRVSAATLLTITPLSMPRLPLFFVPCFSFPVQDDDFSLLTPVIATLATSLQLTVQSLVPIFSPGYSPTTLCQMSLYPKSWSVLVPTPQVSFSSNPIAHATHRILPDKSAAHALLLHFP
jgi:hypothetical protein